jgi:predicted lipoprotein with Yx(FWY)xxD motif
MRIPTFMSLAALLTAGVIAGCGSSGSSGTTTHASATPTGSATPASSQGAYGTSTTAPASASMHAALITTKHSKLGTIMAYGPRKMTVYLFEKDKGAASTCTGACATAWPPVIGTPSAGAGAMAAGLGSITRSDGTKQVTYHGHPLYLFIKDKDDGDAYGQGVNAFGGGWYVLAPSGKKIDES